MSTLVGFVAAVVLALVGAVLLWIVVSIAWVLWFGRYSRLSDIEKRDLSSALEKMHEEWK